jgi:hypothetical protein
LAGFPQRSQNALPATLFPQFEQKLVVSVDARGEGWKPIGGSSGPCVGGGW